MDRRKGSWRTESRRTGKSGTENRRTGEETVGTGGHGAGGEKTRFMMKWRTGNRKMGNRRTGNRRTGDQEEG